MCKMTNNRTIKDAIKYLLSNYHGKIFFNELAKGGYFSAIKDLEDYGKTK